MCIVVSSLKYKHSPDLFNYVRTCARIEYFATEFMDVYDIFQILFTRINSDVCSASKL